MELEELLRTLGDCFEVIEMLVVIERARFWRLGLIACLALNVFLAVTALAELQTNLIDLSPIDEGAFPNVDNFDYRFFSFGGQFYFPASNGFSGIELWRTSGAEASTEQFTDFGEESFSGKPLFLGQAFGKFLFRAEIEAPYSYCNNIPTINISDGTEAGTEILYPYLDGCSHENYPLMKLYDGLLYFGGRIFEPGPTSCDLPGTSEPVGPEGQGSYGRCELWVSDGSTAGTQRLADIIPGSDFGYPRDLTEANGVLFFLVENGTNSRSDDLWVTDGTILGTQLLYPGCAVDNCSPSILFVFQDNLYFQGQNAGELWRTDGTPAGTVLVKDFNAEFGTSVAVSRSAVTPDKVFISIGPTSYGAEKELWVSDGTEAGTLFLSTVELWSSSIYANGVFYFSGRIRGYEQELWRSDGTAVGTYLLKEIYPGVNQYGDYHSGNPRNFLVLPSGLILFAASNSEGSELWRSDGTAVGTYLFKDLYPGFSDSGNANSSNPSQVQECINGMMLFTATNELGTELWKTDGTPNGTEILKDIASPGSSSPRDFHCSSSGLYFRASDPASNQELWLTDGTTDGTNQVKNINRRGGSHPSNLVAIGDEVVFASTILNSEGTRRGALWRSDGTRSGTIPIDLPIEPRYQPSALTRMGGDIFFLSTTPSGTLRGLWKTDGTSAGTSLVKDPKLGGYFGEIQDLVVVGNELFFTLYDGIGDIDVIWKTDGTEAGTVMVKSLNPGGYINVQAVIASDTLMFLSADIGDGDGKRIWRTDGTAAGTFRISNSPEMGQYYNWTTIGPNLYFAHGDAVYRSDGTAGGTYPLTMRPLASIGALISHQGKLYFGEQDYPEGFIWESDLTPSGTSTYFTMPYWLTIKAGISNGNRFFFSVQSSIYKGAVWESDGTEIGTRQIIQLGELDLYPRHLGRYRAGVALSGYYYPDGFEPWIADGTDSGTRPIAFLNPLGSSDPAEFVEAADQLFFVAEDGHNGRELWVTSESSGYKLGDMDCDGMVTFLDIGNFIRAIGEQADYDNPDCPDYLRGDMNQDGEVNFSDIVGFVAALGT